jgi:hypothetical protein
VERFRMIEFVAPLPLAAVALMAVNDRLLKPWFGNAVTGKLSDIAVCFFLPLFTSALLGLAWRKHPRARVLVGAGIATLVYTAQEMWPWFRDTLLAMLRVVGPPLGLRSFGLTDDVTDLLALLMVPLAVAYGWRRLRPPPPAPIATSGSESRLPGG